MLFLGGLTPLKLTLLEKHSKIRYKKAGANLSEPQQKLEVKFGFKLATG